MAYQSCTVSGRNGARALFLPVNFFFIFLPPAKLYAPKWWGDTFVSVLLLVLWCPEQSRMLLYMFDGKQMILTFYFSNLSFQKSGVCGRWRIRCSAPLVALMQSRPTGPRVVRSSAMCRLIPQDLGDCHL